MLQNESVQMARIALVAPEKKLAPSLAPVHKKPLIIIIIVSYQQVIDT